MVATQHILDSVSVRLLRRYLNNNGWLVTTHSDVSLHTLSASDDGDSIEIVLPVSEGNKEAVASSVSSAIATLAQLSARPFQDVIAEIRQVGADVIRSVVPDSYVRADSVALRLAQEFVSGFRSFLSSAGTMEIAPNPYHAKTLKHGLEFADGCRFGHTFRGSFGFTVEAPIEANEDRLLIGRKSELPFSRRVVERVARGLRAVDEAAKAQAPEVIADSYGLGMDANMCDDLAELLESTGVGSLGISIAFSPEWPTSTDVIGMPKIQMHTSHVELLHEASKLLRKSETPSVEKIIGRITGLHTDGNPADLFKDPAARLVEISWQSPAGRLVTVHVMLDAKDYLEALRAHGEGKFIEITGLLEKVRRRWTLSNSGGFSVMD